MIEVADPERLYTEFRFAESSDPNEWLSRNGLAQDALTPLAFSQAKIVANLSGLPVDVLVVGAAICSAFQLGWEAHRQYGGAAAS